MNSLAINSKNASGTTVENIRTAKCTASFRKRRRVVVGAHNVNTFPMRNIFSLWLALHVCAGCSTQNATSTDSDVDAHIADGRISDARLDSRTPEPGRRDAGAGPDTAAERDAALPPCPTGQLRCMDNCAVCPTDPNVQDVECRYNFDFVGSCYVNACTPGFNPSDDNRSCVSAPGNFRWDPALSLSTRPAGSTYWGFGIAMSTDGRELLVAGSPAYGQQPGIVFFLNVAMQSLLR